MAQQHADIQNSVLNTIRHEKMPVSIHTINGYQIHKAFVLGHDNFVVLIEVDGKQSMLYKHAISTITPEKPIGFFNAAQDYQK